MTGRAVGIDIGGTNVRVAVGVTSEPGSATIRRVATPHSYAALLGVVLDMVRELSPDGVHPSAVGVGIPGTTTGQRTEFVPALPFLDGAPIGSDLQDRLHRPVRLANDAHCALLAEHRIGAAVGRSSAVMLVIGTGVGGAMLFNGSLYRGAHGAAGAFGWLPAVSESDERHGGFEQLVSGRAVERLAEALGTSAPRMFDAARAGIRRHGRRCRATDMPRVAGWPLSPVCWIRRFLSWVASSLPSSSSLRRPSTRR